MYGRVVGVTVLGVGGHLVTVEAFVGRGLPSLVFTGSPRRLGERCARPRASGRRERRPRMAAPARGREPRARQPPQGRAGTRSPVAVGVLAATSQVPAPAVVGYAFAGELSLKGELLPTPGILSVAIAAARAGLNGVVVPAANAREAAQIGSLRIVAAATLADVARFLQGAWDPSRSRYRGDRARRGVEGRPRRGPRTGAGPSRPRGRGRRWAQPPHDRTAGRRQNDARPASGHDPPGALARGGAGSDAVALRGRAPGRPRRAHDASVPRAPSLGVDRRSPRRRIDVPASGRGEPGSPRGPVLG